MKTTLALALTASTLLASAAAADGIEKFRIGLAGSENAQDQLAKNQCLADYIGEALGVPTELFVMADYAGLQQGMLGGSIDLGWMGASNYAGTYLNDPEAVEPIRVKTNLDGSFSYHSIGFARADSGIGSLDDMKGKVFGFGDPNSTSGYLIPSVEIPPAIDATMESGDYFGEVKFTGGHEQTIVAVFNGDIDGGVTWADGLGAWEDGYNSGALRKAVDAGLVDMNELVEIWKSKPIPEGPMVVRKALPQDVKDKVDAVLANLHEVDIDCAYGVAAGETAGFQPIDHSAYETIIEVRRAKTAN